MAAAGLPRAKRHLALTIGLGGAVVLLCLLAFFAMALLRIGGGGLVLGGGLLLLLVSWQMLRDLRGREPGRDGGAASEPGPHTTLTRALVLIFIADISTSLDNVLAIAGAARGQPWWLLFVGLAISVGFTGFAAAWLSRLLQRWPWIGYLGLAIVLIVALRMIWDGAVVLGWLRAVGV